MKKLFIIITLVFGASSSHAQKVFSVDYESQAGSNDGKWFFTQYGSQAKKKIFFVDYESRADLKIFFVEYESQAGWRTNSKKSLMY